MLAPNKQNLIILKNQKKLVANGHKLLKEKRSGLIVTFLDFAKKGRTIEKKASEELSKVLKIYKKSLTFASSSELREAITQVPSLAILVQKKRVSGVYIDSIDIKIKVPQRKNLKKNISGSLKAFAHYFPLILELSQLKLNSQRISKEIEKTSRQILNLERRIEEIDQEIKYINSALREKENLERATLIKIFK